MNKLAAILIVILMAGTGPALSSAGSSSPSSPPAVPSAPRAPENPGVELPAVVVPMAANGHQAGYFYLTMALEVRGEGWETRQKVPFIQDALVRWVYANPIPAGMTEEEALDILSEAVIAIANEITGTSQVTGLVYRDVSTGF